jgi:hypothetical protein
MESGVRSLHKGGTRRSDYGSAKSGWWQNKGGGQWDPPAAGNVSPSNKITVLVQNAFQQNKVLLHELRLANEIEERAK